MSWELKSEDQRELDNLMHGQEVKEIEAIFYDGKKDKRRIFRRIKIFLKAHRNIRVIIKPNQIILQDKNE